MTETSDRELIAGISARGFQKGSGEGLELLLALVKLTLPLIVDLFEQLLSLVLIDYVADVRRTHNLVSIEAHLHIVSLVT